MILLVTIILYSNKCSIQLLIEKGNVIMLKKVLALFISIGMLLSEGSIAFAMEGESIPDKENNEAKAYADDITDEEYISDDSGENDIEYSGNDLIEEQDYCVPDTVENTLEDSVASSEIDFTDDGAFQDSYPSYFYTSNLPPLRNQGKYNASWAFASIALAEISLMKRGAMKNPDLSELHLLYFENKTVEDPLGGTEGDYVKPESSDFIKCGGSMENALSTLQKWTGLASEHRVPYSATSIALEMGIYDSLAYDDVAHIESTFVSYVNTSELRNSKDLSLLNPIRKMVVEYGAAAFCFGACDISSVAKDKIYSEKYASYYNQGYVEPNYAAVIVGWDDNFPSNHFAKKAPGDGAFLVRNSMAASESLSALGYEGYFWMSYYEPSIYDRFYAVKADVGTNYDNNYQYDGLSNYAFGFSQEGANVFVAKADSEGEVLKAVSFCSYAEQTDYKVEIYTDVSDAPDTGTLIPEATMIGKTDLAGYLTVPLEKEVDLHAGCKFAVVITLGSKGLVYDTSISDKGYKVTAHKGESFSYENGKWQSKNSNYRIKAFTNNKGSGMESESEPVPETVAGFDFDVNRILQHGKCGEDAEYWVDANGCLLISGTGKIKERAFEETSIKKVFIKDGIESIGYRAFYNCKELERVVCPNTLSTLYSEAFWNCPSLLYIYLPKSLRYSPKGLFVGDEKLKTAGPVGKGYNIEFGWDTAIPGNVFYCCDSLISIVLPEGIESIGSNAFNNCEKLEYINIPSTLNYEYRRDYFKGCKKLASAGPIKSGCNIEFAWTEKIPDYAFSGSDYLETIIIPESVQSIGEYAFSECIRLIDVSFPKTMAKIGEYAFMGCKELYYISLPKGIQTISDGLFYDCTSLEGIKIPDDVISIDLEAFYNCISLEYCYLPGNLSSISMDSFAECKSLKSILIPKSIRSFGVNAFRDCEALEEVKFEEGLEKIPAGALAVSNIFDDDNYLGYVKKVTIPSTVKTIGHNAFKGQSNLMYVIYGGSDRDKDNIDVADGNENLLNARWTCTKIDQDWGDVTEEYYSLFNNNSANLPKGIWYALDEDGNASYYTASAETTISKAYTGAEIRLTSLKVFDGNKRLAAGTDYALSYLNNVNAGDSSALNAPSVKIIDKISNTPSVVLKYTIMPASIKNATITSSRTITVRAIDRAGLSSVEPVIALNGKTLNRGSDYVLEYYDGENEIDGDVILDQEGKTYTIVIEGIGNYIDMADDQVNVFVTAGPELKGNMKNVKLAGFKSTVSYTGNILTVSDLFNANDKVCQKEAWNSVTLYVIDKKTKSKIALTEGIDYLVSVGERSNVGKVYVTFTGIGGFTGTKSKIVTIKAAKVAKDFNIVTGDAIYSKAGVKPTVAVSYSGVTLKEGIDYTVSYKNNKKAALSTDIKAPYVVVKAKGNYSGTSKKVTFTIQKADVSSLQMSVKNVAFKANGAKGYFLAKPIFTDNGKKVTVGKNKDIRATYTYTYAEDIILKDGTIRKIGDAVDPVDKLPGPISIKITAKVVSDNSKSSYEGSAELSHTYYIVNR